MSLRRLMTFFGDLFTASPSAGRRLEKSHQEQSPAMMRGALMRAVRQSNLPSLPRELEVVDDPLADFQLNEFISLTFDFNFGDGHKELLFGLQFQYDSGDSLTESTKELLQTFMNETLGSSSEMPNQGGFSFVDTAVQLANDLVQSLVIDIAVDLDFSFGLDLNPVFNSTLELIDRLPDPFIQINQFEIQGMLGVNEWSSSFDFSGLDFLVTEAKALLNISSSLSSPPLKVNNITGLTALVNDGIDFQASLDVAFPVFLVADSVGFGGRIEYLDENLFDEEIPSPTLTADILVETAKIQWAAGKLRDSMEFLGNFDVLDEEIPLIQKSVNDLIAGPDRTIVDVFDLTDWADSLQGTSTESNNSPDMIALSELLNEMRSALSSLMLPELPSDELPPIPDLNNFNLPPIMASNNCNGNDKAISLDIKETSGVLEITICTFLELELEGELSTPSGLFNELEEHVNLELDAGFVLKGAFSAGIKLSVAIVDNAPQIDLELDPILTQLFLQTDLSASASLGMLTATVSGDCLLSGEFSFGYCPSCTGTYLDGYERAGENSTFYLKRLIGYELGGGVELSLDSSSFMPGLDLGIGAEIGVEDNNVFDDIPPVIELPSLPALSEAMRFSPEFAVSKFTYGYFCKSVTSVHVSPPPPLSFSIYRDAAGCRQHDCTSN